GVHELRGGDRVAGTVDRVGRLGGRVARKVQSPGAACARGMRFRFTLDGAAYSKNKDAFKEILKRHGLGFKGSRDTFVWSSRSESVTAMYERDEARDLTIRADLLWQSRKKTPLLNELKEWVWSVGGHGGEEDDATPDK